ncbi:hypothetical protein LCGC14_2393610, partial [marine sediment metagenome]
MDRTNGDILLLSDNGVAEDITRLSGGAPLSHFRQPYPALEELARRHYGALLVAEGYPDLPGLVRAARRLSPDTRVFALCSPAGEAELRSSDMVGLEDYFVFPPTAEELDRVLRPSQVGVYQPVVPPEPVADFAGEISELLDAAGSEELAERIRKLAGRWTGRTLRWAEPAASGESGRPVLLMDTNDGPRVLLDENDAELPAQALGLLESLQRVAGPLAAQTRRAEALHRLAITDFLTGAYNRRYFYHFTDQLLQRARAEKFRVTLLLYDIDNFKRYNDSYSHATGDEILREIASLMDHVTREHDVVARIGGDEFAVLFWDDEPPRRPDSRHPQTAADLAERFMAVLAKHEFECLGPEARGVLTISGGLA